MSKLRYVTNSNNRPNKAVRCDVTGGVVLQREMGDRRLREVGARTACCCFDASHVPRPKFHRKHEHTDCIQPTFESERFPRSCT